MLVICFVCLIWGFLVIRLLLVFACCGLLAVGFRVSLVLRFVSVLISVLLSIILRCFTCVFV